MNWIKSLFMSDDWKRVFAWTCVYGFVYNILFWPLAIWGAAICTMFAIPEDSKLTCPGPPLVPWEQLAAMTGMLAVVGGVQFLKDRRPTGSITETESVKETVIVKGKGK